MVAVAGFIIILTATCIIFMSLLYSHTRDYIWANMILPLGLAFFLNWFWVVWVMRDYVYKRMLQDEGTIICTRLFIALDLSLIHI